MLDTINQYLQAIAMALAALWNAIQAYEAWPKAWKVALSALSAIFLAFMAWNRAWPIF